MVNGYVNQTAIREIRAEMGRQRLSQQELASRLGWKPFTLSRRLRGLTSLSLDELQEIGKVLDISILQLLYPRDHEVWEMVKGER